MGQRNISSFSAKGSRIHNAEYYERKTSIDLTVDLSGPTGTTRKWIFSVGLIAATGKSRRYNILIAVAKADPHCNAIFKLLLLAALAMSVVKNTDPMAPKVHGKYFIFTIANIAAAIILEGKMYF